MSDAPLPPAPLLSPLQAGAAAAAAALGQLWGYLNQRRTGEGRPIIGDTVDFGEPKIITLRWTTEHGTINWNRCSDGEPAGTNPGNSFTYSDRIYWVDTMTFENCYTGDYKFVCGDTFSGLQKTAKMKATSSVVGPFERLLGTVQTGEWLESGSPQRRSGDIRNGVTVLGWDVNDVPAVFPPIADPFVFPPEFPDPELLPEEDGAPGVLPPLTPPFAPPDTAPPDAEPLPVPGDPGTGTGTGTGTGISTGAAGQLLPLRPPVVAIVPPPVVAPPNIVTGTGIVSPPVITPPVTPPGVEVTPDGPIGQPGTPPPPTLDGIAAEVGKIEQKTRQLLDRPPLSLTDLLAALEDLLTPEPETDPYPAGSYVLNPVCEEKDPVVANWSAGDGSLNLLNAKLDALAELLQAHKDFRQPTCVQGSDGQPVTVQFQEIG